MFIISYSFNQLCGKGFPSGKTYFSWKHLNMQLVLRIGPVKTQNFKGFGKNGCRVTQIRSFIPETLTAMAAKVPKTKMEQKKQGSSEDL